MKKGLGDPLHADSLFTDLNNKYEELKNHQGQLLLNDAVYSGHLDSLRDCPGFFEKPQLLAQSICEWLGSNAEGFTCPKENLEFQNPFENAENIIYNYLNRATCIRLQTWLSLKWLNFHGFSI